MEAVCSTCGETKKIHDKVNMLCQKCYQKKWYQNNRERKLEHSKQYNKKRYLNDHDNQIEYHRKWRENNKDNLRKYDQKRYNSRRDKILNHNKIWYQNNKFNKNKQVAKRTHERIKTDINFKIRCALRSRLNSAINNNQKSGSAVRDLGCSIEEFKAYLESKFTEGMTWDNWTKDGWHIDHIVPLSSFNLEDREELLKACHYTNLQPMWAEDNLKKSNKIV